MSDFFAPSYWYGAGPGAAFSHVNNAVAQNQANMIPNMNANMAYVGGQNQAALNNAYGPMGFGGQTAMYAGLGAAYGRATGGFNAQPGAVGTISNPGTSNPGYLGGGQPQAPQPPAQQHQPGSSWIDPTPGAGAGAGYYGNGFNPDAYLTTHPDVAKYAVDHGMNPQLFAEEHAMSRGVIESRSGAEPFGNPFTWGNQAGGGNPFGPVSQSQWYQGLGGDAWGSVGTPYEPLYQTPFNERLLGIDQDPNIDFDERWGNTPTPTGRPFQQEYEDMFNDLTRGQRQRSGSLESYFERNPDIWDAAKASGSGVLAFAGQHLRNYGENEGREIFNPIRYLNENQDVKKAGVDAWTHYDTFGRNEGRNATWGNVFDPETYLMNNKDVADAGVDARTHYLTYGQYEGRNGGVIPGGDVFNADVYKRLNPDVAQAGVDPLTHWQTYGRDEGRQGAGTVETDRDSVARTLLAREMAQQYGKAPTAAGAALTHPGAAANQPSSGNIGIQSTVMQDPFGGYRSPTDMNAGGGFPANYQQGYYAQQGFDPNWGGGGPGIYQNSPFGN